MRECSVIEGVSASSPGARCAAPAAWALQMRREDGSWMDTGYFCDRHQAEYAAWYATTRSWLEAFGEGRARWHPELGATP